MTQKWHKPHKNDIEYKDNRSSCDESIENSILKQKLRVIEQNKKNRLVLDGLIEEMKKLGRKIDNFSEKTFQRKNFDSELGMV